MLLRYEELCSATGSNDKLVLLNNAQAVRDFREKIQLKRLDNLNVYSYFSFLQQEIKNYWDLIEEKLPGKRNKIAPIFMTVEPVHYIMSKLVEKEHKKGHFINLKSTPQQIALQLIDNLNHAALNNLSLKEAGERLLKLADDETKQTAYKRGIKVMEAFHNFCLNRRCIDYSLLIILYHKYLLSNQEYLNQLENKYNYLFVADLEMNSISTQKLILKLETIVKESYLSFNPEAKGGGFFGAAPWLVEENFFADHQLVELESSEATTSEAVDLINKIEARFNQGQQLTKAEFIKDIITTEFRGEMFNRVAKKVLELVENGVEANKIALIAPFSDRVLEFSLNNLLTESEVELFSLVNNRLLLNNSFAKALIVLTLLVKSDWEIEISQYSLVKTINLIFALDPLRASLLAEEIKQAEFQLPDLEKNNLRDQLGFKFGEEYDQFRDWIISRQQEDLELDLLFKEVFASFLTNLAYQQQDILACRQLINSFDKFKQVLKEFKADFSERDLGYRFIEMLMERTLAADVLVDSKSLKDNLLLATPYKFLNSPQVEAVDYLFLLDISSKLWFMGANKELTNPYILNQREDSWDDSKEQSFRKEQALDYLKNILHKTKEGVYLFKSKLNSKGWEQDGQLADYLEGY